MYVNFTENIFSVIFLFLFHRVYLVRDTVRVRVRVSISGVRDSILGCVAVLTVP